MTDKLNAGQTLQINQYLTSPNGLYRAVMQADGYLKLNPASNMSQDPPIWRQPVAQATPGDVCTMRSDGFAIINASTIWKKPNFSSSPGAWLAVKDCGQLSIEDGGGSYWTSNSCHTVRAFANFDAAFEQVERALAAIEGAKEELLLASRGLLVARFGFLKALEAEREVARTSDDYDKLPPSHRNGGAHPHDERQRHLADGK